MSDITIDIQQNSIEVHHKKAEPWKVTLVDTGELTQTGGRLKRVAEYIDGDFCMTYGDGVGSVDITKLIKFHKDHGKLSTMTAVRPAGRFGALKVNGTQVESFLEKPQGDGGWINGGFFVLKSNIFQYIKSDETIFERQPLETLSKLGELQSFFHSGFWQPMDTLRDRTHLEELWSSGNAPWKSWT